MFRDVDWDDLINQKPPYIEEQKVYDYSLWVTYE